MRQCFYTPNGSFSVDLENASDGDLQKIGMSREKFNAHVSEMIENDIGMKIKSLERRIEKLENMLP